MKPLKRHPRLLELSREHHHALALCLRILRDPTADHQADIESHIPGLLKHFETEETQFAPHWFRLNDALRRRFENEHTQLRSMINTPQFNNKDWNTSFAQTLREHARFEERELFPSIEPFLD